MEKIRRAILIGFLGLTVGGTAVCSKNHVTQSQESYAERIDDLENEWIRLKAKAEGKSDLEAEFRVFKDELDESFSGLKSRIERLDDATEDERETIENEIQEAISKIERSIDEARRDLG
jgi:hypothetical protein